MPPLVNETHTTVWSVGTADLLLDHSDSKQSREAIDLPLYTLSGRIGKVVASHAAVARSSPAEVALIYTMHVALRGYYL